MRTFWIVRRFGFGRAALALLLTVGASASTAVQAQDPTTVAAPAHIAFVDGAVTLEREGSVDAARVNEPVIAGDRLRTPAGRVEVLFPDGTAIDLDESSSVEVLSPTLVRLASGRATLLVAGADEPSSARYQVDTPAASARTDGPGEYRVAAFAGRDTAETELAVVRGVASLATERGTVSLRAGERSVALENGAPSLPQAFNSARLDPFDRWTAERRADRATAASAQYLPRDLQMYSGALDQSGSWQYAAPYGYVWYPSVAAGWRPYYYGSWSPVRSYGWTWVGTDLWSWPTHHYGRWGYTGGAWFWIPGRTWAPAWVSWAAAPGYVSWCPLGIDGRAVFALAIGRGDPWVGWVVVPRTSFGRGDHFVYRHAIAPYELPRTTPFIVQATAPVAVPAAAGRIAAGVSREGRVPDRVAAGRPTTTEGRAPAARDGRGPAAARRMGPAATRPAGQQEPPQRSTGSRGSDRGGRLPTDDRQLTTDGRRPAADRPRAPEVAGPRYRTPAPELQGQGATPRAATTGRTAPPDRTPSVVPESRGVKQAPHAAAEGSPPGRQAEPARRSAPAPVESRGAPRSNGRER
jgi:hypothetical protein